MIGKLRITARLLLANFLDFSPDIYHQPVHKGIGKKTSLLMFFFLLSLTGYGQLALETFESGIPTGPNQWAISVETIGTSQWTTSPNGYQGSNGAAFLNPTSDNIGNGNTSRYYLISPLIEVPTNGQLRFYTKQGDLVNHGTQFEIRLSTASQPDISGFTTVLQTWTESNLTTTSGYEEKVVDIPDAIAPGIEVYVAFVLVNNQTATTPTVDSWLIDNVQLQTEVPCDPVLGTTFTATGLTPVSANLAWTHPTATQFEIQILSGAQVVGPVGQATDNTYTAPNLTPGTAYRAYIKTICPSSSSTWAGPFNFTTPIMGTSCAYPLVVPPTGAPYVFSANLNTFAFAGAPTFPNPGTSCLPPAVTQNYLLGAKAYFSYTPTQDGIISVKNVTNSSSFNHSTGFFIYDGCSNVGVQCIGAATTSAVNVPGYINNTFVQAGHTYFIVLSSNLQASAGIAFTITINTAQCAPPSVFTFKDLLQTSGKFSWDNVGNLSTAWEYKVQAAGAGAPTGAGTATTTNVDNLINTGLVAGTPYDLYVRSVCGGVPGPWSAPYRFTTQCTVFPTPYTQNFTGTSATVPAPCWTSIDVNNDGLFWSYQSSAANLTTNTYQNSNNDIFATPHVDLGTTPKRLKYKVQIVNGIAKYAIKLSTTGVGASNFTTVLMPETAFNNNTYQEKIINIPTSITGPVNIAFVVVPGTGSTATRILIDDVIIEDKPVCPNPVTPTATGITTSTAVLAWTAGDTESQWQIAVQPKGTGIPTGSGVLINTNTYSPSLNHATQYEYYVRAYCDATHQSNWVGPINFTTLCSTFTVPFYESFNDADVATTHKFCWTVNNANTDNAQWTMQANNPQIAGNPFFGTPSYNDYLISPAINVVGTKELKFKYKAAFSPLYGAPRFGMEVLMSTTDTNPASFSVIMPFMEFTNTDYVEKALYINANGPVYIAFRVPPAFIVANGGSSILMIDDVSIDEAPACPNPSLPVVSNITQSAAQFSWTPGFMETQWEVKVQPVGTGVPTTPGVLTSSHANVTSGSLSVTLLPNTQYEYYVRAYCNDTEQSEWIGPVIFTTLCTAFPTPFIETFETNSVSKECWRVTDINDDTFFWFLNMTANPYEGALAAAMFTGTNGANNDYLISPTITIGPNQRLRYYYRVTYSDFTEDLEVRLSTTGVEPSSFTTVLYATDTYPTPINNQEWKEKVINLPDGTTGDINIAWHIPPRPALGQGYRGQSLVIDKVIIEDIPACPAPTNLSVQNLADTQTQIKWDSTGTETAWDVYVQPAGLAAPVGDGDPQYLHATTTNPYTVTNLDPATQYDYYVRSSCTGSDSVWVGPMHFTTMCSFENLCEYTITLANPINFGDIQGEIYLMQNEVTVQTLTLAATAGGSSSSYVVFLCDGVEFSLFWNAVGSVPSGGEAQATVTIAKADGTNVWTSPAGIGPLNHIIYSGFVSCSPITCPQPTNQSVNSNGVFTWTAGGTEAEWEVFIQPLDNGTLPTTGTIVSTTNYTPVAADFDNANIGTYEYFVRAVCNDTDKSFWTGPYEFARNDASNKAMVLPVNPGAACENAVTAASFMGATPSSEATTCAGTNDGDVWFEFEATSKVHIIKADNFSGDYYYANGEEPQPIFTMTLYKVVGTGLQQITCTTNNAILAAYSTELEIGETYKVRLTLNGTSPNIHTFDVCVTTPQDVCTLNNIINGGFENPSQGAFSEFTRQQVVLGWRNNVANWEEYFLIGPINTYGVAPYEGGQFIQMLTSNVPQDPGDLVNITGDYQDLDSSEITKFDYSFAHAGRSEGRIVQLFAGPPSGPFTLLEEHNGTMAWSVVEGQYDVPASQPVTRFIFRSKNNDLGNLLDAVSITANNELITQAHTLDCATTETTLESEGVGEWIADEANPGPVVITTPTSKTTTVTGFVISGDYTFHWKTRYCDYTVVVTNIAEDDIPVVEPVGYCVGATAVALTAPALADHTQAWYDVETGGTALPGAPIPSTATEGTTSYYVSYINADGCEGQRAEIEVTVTPVTSPVTDFSYDAASYCTGGTAPVLTTAADFVTGGIFTATPDGLTIDTATGAITLATSEAGTYTITYNVDASGCVTAGSSIATVIVEATVVAVTGFTYNETYCTAEAVNPLPTPAAGFTAGGQFMISTGGAINPSTGEIDLANTPVGTYTITYTVDTLGCLTGGSTPFTVIIAPLTAVSVDFSYESPSCLNFGEELVPEVSNDFAFGGTFTSTTLTVNAQTGVIDLTTATEGPHEVIYIIAADPVTCKDGATSIASLVINSGVTPVTEFSYDSAYCSDSANELPLLAAGFTTGGTFTSSPEGLNINTATGEINIAASTPGVYTVIYTVATDEAACNLGGSHSFTLSVAGNLKVEVASECRGQNLWLTAVPVDGSFDPATVSYTWKNQAGITVGSGADFNVAEYYAQSPSALPIDFTVTVAAGSCSNEAGYTVMSVMCQIPRGVSPNGDGDNDTFDLTSLGVIELNIFNRYGREVYKFEGNYTNQWHGQDRGNKELPDGTYFYSIHKSDGTSLTGWVYISREY